MNTKFEPEIPFARPVYVRSVLDCLNSLGIPPSRVLSHAGLSWQDVCDGQHMVDFSVFRRLVAHAIQCSGEPALGLIAGSMLQPYTTPVGIAAVTGTDLGESLQFLSRHARLIYGSFDFRLENGPQWSTLEVKPLRPLCETHVFVMQSILAAHCRLLEAILGRHVDELSAGMPYPRPLGNDVPCLRYVRRVEFDQEHLSLRLPAALLRSQCVSRDADAFANAAQACRRLESELGHGAFVQRVRHALLEQLTTNPDIGKLASDLGLSSRTLARRLSEVGVTYSDLKDDLRKTQATWYLQHTELPIEAIASQLGYADHANFSRKFKDWYRVAPSKMRQALHFGTASATVAISPTS